MSEKLFLQHIRQNQGIIYKLVGLYAVDSEEKKDLYQEILLNAWKGWPAFKGEAKFSTWLYRLCLNTIFAQKRKVNRVDYRESLETISPAAEKSPGENDDVVRLRQAIRMLAETDRAIVSMNLDGYDNAEIAGVMGISKNHVAVKLHRSKEQLANLLKRI